MSDESLTWTHLEQFGLAVTYRQAPASGWGYTWRGRSWEGPYETRLAALAAAFSRAIDSLILSGLCPYQMRDYPLLRPPPRSYVEPQLGRDEEEDPWWHEEDRES